MQPNLVHLPIAMGFQYENYDPFVTSFKRLACAMLSCFVNDIESYKRLKMRKYKQEKITTTVQWHHDQIRDAYASALSWARDRSDYFLSIKSCAEAVGIDVDDYLNRVLIEV